MERHVVAQQTDIMIGTNALTPGLWPFEAAIELGLPYVIMLLDYSFACPVFTRMRSQNHFCRGQVPETECVACASGRLGRFKQVAFSALRQTRSAAESIASLSSTHHAFHRYYAGTAEMRSQRREDLKEIFTQAQAVIYQSEIMRQEYHDAGLSNQNESVVAFGVPIVEPLAERLKSSRPYTFAYCSRPVWEWGFRILAQVWLENFAQRDDIELLVASPGAQRFLDGLGIRYGRAKNIRFSHELIQGRVAQFYSQVDCCVVPALWHGIVPLTALEALGCGVPVLGPMYDGLSKFLGVHHYDGSPDGLREAIQRAARGGCHQPTPRGRSIDDWAHDLRPLFEIHAPAFAPAQ
jgi:glycosyltransferase involved in cell wall biosynthesis